MSYEQKHNEANGEDNRDGHNDNISRNWGVEGRDATNPRIRRQRERMKRNFLATLAFSQGVPMLRDGDEMGRTQRGNNNAYAQDNEITWVDWDLDRRATRAAGVHAPSLRRVPRQPGAAPPLLLPRPAGGRRRRARRTSRGCGRTASEMSDDDWDEPDAHVLGMLIDGEATDEVDDRGRPVVGPARSCCC